MRPITNVYRPMFRVRCAACDRWGDAHHMAAGTLPFTYFCLAHVAEPERRAIEVAYDEQFRALPAEAKHAARVQVYGEARTREIERGLPIRPF